MINPINSSNSLRQFDALNQLDILRRKALLDLPKLVEEKAKAFDIQESEEVEYKARQVVKDVFTALLTEITAIYQSILAGSSHQHLLIYTKVVVDALQTEHHNKLEEQAIKILCAQCHL